MSSVDSDYKLTHTHRVKLTIAILWEYAFSSDLLLITPTRETKNVAFIDRWLTDIQVLIQIMCPHEADQFKGHYRQVVLL